MRGRRIALLAGVLTLVTVSLVVPLGWNWLLESWYLWRLTSADANARQTALVRLPDVATVRAVPALIEAIRIDRAETPFVREADSESFRFSNARKRPVAIKEQDAAHVLLTPAASALYCVGRKALPAIREAWPAEDGRVRWALEVVAYAITRNRDEVKLLTPHEAARLHARKPGGS